MNRHIYAEVAKRLAISADHLRITYEGASSPAIEDCSLTVYEGEAVLIIGPSGSGKSTLAMALAGVIPRSIEATVEGECALAEHLQAPGKIGYVFQDPEAQFCMRRVDDEIAFGLENICVPRAAMPDGIHAALAEVGLTVSTSAAHTHFSGGMKQKLAIASALALTCELLILDEPTANLDPLSTRQVFEQVARLREQGKTLVIIEHKYEPLLPYVDKVVVVDATGHIEQVCTSAAWQQQHHQVQSTHQLSASANATCIDESPVLTVDHARLTYANQQVWRDITFSLHQGEWVAILGPNGAGKSSLLEVMAGLQPPTDGAVALHGKPISRVKSKLRYQQIAYGFQNPEYQFLYERVGDEMAGRVIADSIPVDVLKQLAAFGLEDHALQSPYALSQGQKRRLSVAVMLQQAHDVYLFDEPTYGQDAVSEKMILDRLQALREQGKTIVTVTHDMELVKQYATRVLVIAEQGLLYDGDVKGLLQQEQVLERAHLLDDVKPLGQLYRADTNERSVGVAPGKPSQENQPRPWWTRAPMRSIHPGVKILTLLVISVVMFLSNHLAQVGRLWVVPLVLTFALGWCAPWRVAKRVWVIFPLYGIYLWTFAANAAVPPGDRALDWLWFHISLYGLWQGVIVALRTFATVLLAYVFLETTDGTDFVVSLSQTFACAPKLSYGVMAGTSFIAKFEHEWRTLRRARQVRGRAGHPVLRPITYALPILSQAIRLSERVATAMEARGFYGPPAEQASKRTYYRRTPLRAWDFVFGIGSIVVTLALYFV